MLGNEPLVAAQEQEYSLAPGQNLTCPAAQRAQADLPAAEEKVLTGHLSHLALALPEKEPAGQGACAFSPALAQQLQPSASRGTPRQPPRSECKRHAPSSPSYSRSRGALQAAPLSCLVLVGPGAAALAKAACVGAERPSPARSALGGPGRRGGPRSAFGAVGLAGLGLEGARSAAGRRR